jgi:glycine/D-amino acid oxidase-like deaminating enzyme
MTWSRPLWSYTSIPAPEPTSFVPGSSWDVAIVGAGITGCSAALHLALAGARVVVLDRGAPGSATSGSANGQVLPGLHAAPHHILASYGPDLGERILDFSGRAPDMVFGLIAHHAIDCHPVRAGWLETTRKKSGLAGLEKASRAWAARGAPAEMVGQGEAERLIGTRVYVGGALDRRAGTVQPLSYVHGLAAAAQKAGATICNGVEVQGCAARTRAGVSPRRRARSRRAASSSPPTPSPTG